MHALLGQLPCPLLARLDAASILFFASHSLPILFSSRLLFSIILPSDALQSPPLIRIVSVYYTCRYGIGIIIECAVQFQSVRNSSSYPSRPYSNFMYTICDVRCAMCQANAPAARAVGSARAAHFDFRMMNFNRECLRCYYVIYIATFFHLQTRLCSTK